MDGETVELEPSGANAALQDFSTRSQLAAADPTASIWVSANAGTGKTHTLTSRVARLLLSGTKPEHILCLTFTRAAAAQMQTKLYERLGKWSTMDEGTLAEELLQLEGRPLAPEEIAKARRLFARALETPGGLKIQTIHAFCESLLGRFPLEAGISPHFALADDRQSKELLATARDAVLQDVIDQPDSDLARAAVRLAGETDERGLEQLLTEVTQSRHRLRALVEKSQGVDAVETAIADALGIAPGVTPDDLINAAIEETETDSLRAARTALAGGKKTDTGIADQLAAFIAGPDATTWREAYQPAFLTQKGEPRKSLMTKDVAAAHPASLHWLEQEQERVLALQAKCRAAATATMTMALIRIGHAVLDAYEAEKARLALLDYDDLIARTSALLSTREATQWVLYKLDMGLDHILVDEAQDTSPQQWRVIEALVQEFFAGDGARSFAPDDETRSLGLTRTLFAVGDEKQSIYSFQGAEPGTFARMRDRFAAMAEGAGQDLIPIPLHVSWRTADEILAAVDTSFAPEPVRAGVVSGDEEIEHRSVWTGRAGLVELWSPVTPDEVDETALWDNPLDAVSARSKEAKLAARITGKLKDWIGKEELPQRGRTMRPGDVLILVRKRGAFVDELIRQLKTEDIPVAGVDRLVLGDHIAVMDLMALARFAVLPQDDLTLATVLRSPLCGLSEDALYALAIDRDADGTRKSLWASLRDRAAEVPGADEALRYLSEIRARVDVLRPHEFFTHVLGTKGGRAALVARLGMDVHDPLDEFLNQTLAYEAANTPSLQGFIAWMEAGTTEIKRDLDQGGDKVRIMTVHGAKGLEANVVILPDTVQAGGRPGQSSLVAHEDGLLTYSPRAGDADDKSLAARILRAEREDEEYRRLLYVAMTRAMDRLYIAAAHGSRGMQDTSWYVRVRDALSDQPHAVTEEVTFADGPGTVLRLESDQKVEPASEDSGTAQETMPALPDWVSRPAPREDVPLGPLAPSMMPRQEDDPPALSPLAALSGVSPQQRFARGRLTHMLLQHLPGIAVADRPSRARAWLDRAAGAEFDETAKDAIVAEVMAVLDDPVFAPLFAPGSRAEVALAGHVTWRGQRVPLSGQVDRIAVSETAVLIADYKTNRPPPARPEDVAGIYLDQMAAYRALARAAYPGRDVTCALVWTDGARLMTLPDALLDTRVT